MDLVSKKMRSRSPYRRQRDNRRKSPRKRSDSSTLPVAAKNVDTKNKEKSERQNERHNRLSRKSSDGQESKSKHHSRLFYTELFTCWDYNTVTICFNDSLWCKAVVHVYAHIPVDWLLKCIIICITFWQNAFAEFRNFNRAKNQLFCSSCDLT